MRELVAILALAVLSLGASLLLDQAAPYAWTGSSLVIILLVIGTLFVYILLAGFISALTGKASAHRSAWRAPVLLSSTGALIFIWLIVDKSPYYSENVITGKPCAKSTWRGVVHVDENCSVVISDRDAELHNTRIRHIGTKFLIESDRYKNILLLILEGSVELRDLSRNESEQPKTTLGTGQIFYVDTSEVWAKDVNLESTQDILSPDLRKRLPSLRKVSPQMRNKLALKQSLNLRSSDVARVLRDMSPEDPEPSLERELSEFKNSLWQKVCQEIRNLPVDFSLEDYLVGVPEQVLGGDRIEMLSSMGFSITEQPGNSHAASYNAWNILLVRTVRSLAPKSSSPFCGVKFSEFYSSTSLKPLMRHMASSLVYLNRMDYLKYFSREDYLGEMSAGASSHDYENACSEYSEIAGAMRIPLLVPSIPGELGIEHMRKLAYESCHFWLRRWIPSNNEVRIELMAMLFDMITANDKEFASTIQIIH